jgi:hypothetical protein
MAFSKKTWLDRIAEYPTRRRLKKSDGTDEIVSVSREEGAISQEGDAFSAANMNDLEDRVASEFNSLNIKMDGKLSYKQIAIAKPKSTIKITVPYNSAGFIVFNGAISQLFSVWQYCAYSNGLAGKSIVEQGTSVSYNSSGNVLTISNNSSGNSLSLECLLFYGDFPSLTF